jgi:hypothetical protein
VHIGELKQDPVGTAERIYTHFGIPIPDETRNAWQAHVDDDPLSGHGAHHHKAELSGFSPEDVYASMPNYYEHYRSRYGS